MDGEERGEMSGWGQIVSPSVSTVFYPPSLVCLPISLRSVTRIHSTFLDFQSSATPVWQLFKPPARHAFMQCPVLL